MFNTFVRPLLKCNSQIWSPFLPKDITLIERVQRHFTKQAFQRCNINFSSYIDRMNKVGMLTLENRRKFLDMVFLYKLVTNSLHLDFNNFFVFKKSNYALRSHGLKILPKNSFKNNQWSNSFFERAPKLWNSLPENIVISNSLANFKTLLKTYLLTLQCSLSH